MNNHMGEENCSHSRIAVCSSLGVFAERFPVPPKGNFHMLTERRRMLPPLNNVCARPSWQLE
jgi:hypothetical protein